MDANKKPITPIVHAKFLKKWFSFISALSLSFCLFTKEAIALDTIAVNDLPGAAQKTLLLIKRGGPFPHAKDGVVFGNYERVLPKRKRGYYHEFTVKTEGMHHRGPRRIIAGGELQPLQEYYYTDDHYATFKRIKE